MTQPATEVWFYHLERSRLEQVLPNLLERTLARGWRAVVQTGAPERVDALDLMLWTYREDSFLPHGTAGDGYAAEQPVFITTGNDSPNGAGLRFLVDGAEHDAMADYDRVVFIFDGHDESAVAHARRQWKKAHSKDLEVSYWQQNDAGNWEKRA